MNRLNKNFSNNPKEVIAMELTKEDLSATRKEIVELMHEIHF